MVNPVQSLEKQRAENERKKREVGKGVTTRSKYPLRNRQPSPDQMNEVLNETQPAATNPPQERLISPVLSSSNAAAGYGLPSTVQSSNMDELYNFPPAISSETSGRRSEHVSRRVYHSPPPSVPIAQAQNSAMSVEEEVERDRRRQIEKERRMSDMERQVRMHDETIQTLNRLCQELTRLQTESNAERIRHSERIGQNRDAIEELEVNVQAITRDVNQINQNSQEFNRRFEANIESVRRVTVEHAETLEHVRTLRRDVNTLVERPLGNVIRENRMNVNLKLPTFSNAVTERPLEFLGKIERYIRYVDVHQVNLPAILDQALKGTAHDWWTWKEHQIRNFQDFHRLFTDRYWNDAAQGRVRDELFHGSYQAQDNVSMSDYAVRVYMAVRELTNAPPEESIIKSLRHHFELDVQRAILGRRIVQFDDLVSFLQELEQMEPLNKIRDPKRSANLFFERSSTPLPENNSNQSRKKVSGSSNPDWRNRNPNHSNSPNDSGFSNGTSSRPYAQRNSGFNNSNSGSNSNSNSNSNPSMINQPGRTYGHPQGQGNSQKILPRREGTPNSYSNNVNVAEDSLLSQESTEELGPVEQFSENNSIPPDYSNPQDQSNQSEN